MFVCLCNGVTEEQIRNAVCAGASTMAQLGACLGIGAGCGTCQAFAAQLLNETLRIRDLPENRAAA